MVTLGQAGMCYAYSSVTALLQQCYSSVTPVRVLQLYILQNMSLCVRVLPPVVSAAPAGEPLWLWRGLPRPACELCWSQHARSPRLDACTVPEVSRSPAVKMDTWNSCLELAISGQPHPLLAPVLFPPLLSPHAVALRQRCQRVLHSRRTCGMTTLNRCMEQDMHSL